MKQALFNAIEELKNTKEYRSYGCPKGLEKEEDIGHDYLMISVDGMVNYYRMDAYFEYFEDLDCMKLTEVYDVSYWNWDDDVCLKSLDMTEEELESLTDVLNQFDY